MFCIETTNHEGVRTVFTEMRRAQKAEKHPELREQAFLDQVKKTIERPDFVYQDLDSDTRFASYCREFKINSRTRYTKVMVQKESGCCVVITAYRPDYVKERRKTNLLYGNDHD
jgi:hypothetical protein